MLAGQIKLEDTQILWLYREDGFSQSPFNFSQSTVFIMDVTIGHVYSVHHRWFIDTSQAIYDRWKGPSHIKTLIVINGITNTAFEQQRYAFAQTVANFSSHCEPDCLKFLCLTAGHWFLGNYSLSASVRRKVSWKQSLFIDIYFWSQSRHRCAAV